MGHLFLLLLALLLASTHATFHANAAFTEVKSVAGIRGVTGSRPPSCEGRCRSCGHCEAVQVPISPQDLQKKRSESDQKRRLGHGSRAAAYGTGTSGGRTVPSSYDDHSNYKPLNWRCKCGALILNP